MAFSTANRVGVRHASGTARVDILPNDLINPLFEATVWATEEAILNALVSAETMSGVNGHSVPALPHDKLRDVLLQYNRLG